jgi:hypothetical protein
VRFFRQNIPTEYLDIDNWRQISIESLSIKRKDAFVKRQRALKLYLTGSSGKEIKEETSLDISLIINLLKKCLVKEDCGEIVGLRALVPYYRESYFRKKPITNKNGHSGFSGAFLSLLRKYPELSDLLKNNLLKVNIGNNVVTLYERKITFTKLHSKFLKKCRELGLEASYSYPYNTENLAYNSLVKYAKKLLNDHSTDAIIARGGDDSKQKQIVNDGSHRPPLLPYDRVECDAHKIDALFCVLIPTQFGQFVPKILHRIWLIVIEDVASRAIIGYNIVYSKECNSYDVLKCIKHSLSKWERLKLKIPISYHESAGFPSSISDDYIGAKWKNFSCDGALANLANNVETRMFDITNCKPTVIRRRNKDDRPFVERLFGILSNAYFKQLPNTVGSKKEEYLRSYPEVKACKYFIHIEELEEVIDVLLANYNVSPHGAIGQRSPVSYLRFLVEKNQVELERADSEKVSHMMTHSAQVRVKGSLAKGVRPYINFKYVRYSSSVLRELFSLVNKYITVTYDPDDIRKLTAFNVNGESLGYITASPPWHLIPHSIHVRSTISTLKKEKKLFYANYEDPIVAYLDYCEKKILNKEDVTSEYINARIAFTKFVEPKFQNENSSLYVSERESNNVIESAKSTEMNSQMVKKPMTIKRRIARNY